VGPGWDLEVGAIGGAQVTKLGVDYSSRWRSRILAAAGEQGRGGGAHDGDLEMELSLRPPRP
jgi:hypothetical protein